MRSDMSRHARLTAWSLGIAVLVNAASTALLPPNAQPFRVHRDPSAFSIFAEERASLEQGYGFYLRLASVGGRGTIMAPDGLLDPTFVDGLADMDLQIVESTPLTLVEPDPSHSLSGELVLMDGSIARYVIVPPPTDETKFVAFREENVIIVTGAQNVEPRG